MTPPLSIVMASHNDADQTVITLSSIRETAPDDVEVIVVDDCSATPLKHYVQEDEHTKLVTNRYRCGCGPSRHIGASHATGEWLLIVDSHMRFKRGWFECWEQINKCDLNGSPPVWRSGPPTTIFCATCCGLDTDHMDVNNPVSEYQGATMNFHGPDRHAKVPKDQVFEATWLPSKPVIEDGAEIPAIMGACYFISRDWFFHLGALRFLRTWGCDEQMLSLKSWLAGGSVRLAKLVKIGHKFLIDGKERQKFGVPPGHVLWNKFFAINTLLPREPAGRLSALVASVYGREAHDLEAATRMYRDDYHLIAQEREYNRSIFTRDLAWYCKRFGIPMP